MAPCVHAVRTLEALGGTLDKVGLSVNSIGKRNRLPSEYRSVSATKTVGKHGKINMLITPPKSAQLCYC